MFDLNNYAIKVQEGKSDYPQIHANPMLKKSVESVEKETVILVFSGGVLVFPQYIQSQVVVSIGIEIQGTTYGH